MTISRAAIITAAMAGLFAASGLAAAGGRSGSAASSFTPRQGLGFSSFGGGLGPIGDPRMFEGRRRTIARHGFSNIGREGGFGINRGDWRGRRPHPGRPGHDGHDDGHGHGGWGHDRDDYGYGYGYGYGWGGGYLVPQEPPRDYFGFFGGGGRVVRTGPNSVRYDYDRGYPYDYYNGPQPEDDYAAGEVYAEASSFRSVEPVHVRVGSNSGCEMQSVPGQSGDTVSVRVCRR